MKENVRKEWLCWGGLIAFLLGGWFLVGPIISPFASGFLMAYMIHPVIQPFHQRGWNKNMVALAAIVLVYGSLMIALFFLAPAIKNLLVFLVDHLPFYQKKLGNWLSVLLEKWLADIFSNHVVQVQDMLNSLVGYFFRWTSRLLSDVLSSSLRLTGTLLTVLFSPVIAFHLLREWGRLEANVLRFAPVPVREKLPHLFARLDRAFRGYVQGQIFVCLALATFYGLSLSFTGIRFSFAVGIVCGFLAFIPYVGFFTGVLGAFLLALLQEASGVQMMYLVWIFLGGQMLESFFLVPYFVGSRTGLHPLWVLFAIFAGGHFRGFWGVFLALPVATLIKAVSGFVRDYYGPFLPLLYDKSLFSLTQQRKEH